MTAEEIAQRVQFTVDRRGQVTAVVVTPDLWHQLLAALEDAEDRVLVQSLKERLAAGPVAAGALRWQDVAHEWV